MTKTVIKCSSNQQCQTKTKQEAQLLHCWQWHGWTDHWCY